MNPENRPAEESAAALLDTATLTPAEKQAIREQLARVTASPGFRNSRKYPTLLRYLVEESIEGRSADLKERTLGVQVFGREPDYDTNADPVVRTTAAEVRKRIAQYYHEHSEADELRIDLRAGAYLPEFRFPAPPTSAPPPVSPRPWHSRRGVLVTAGAVLLLTLGGALTYRLTGKSVVERFWAPVIASNGSIVLCVGPPVPLEAGAAAAAAGPISVNELEKSETQHIALSDSMAVSLVAAVLRGHDRHYQIRTDSSVSLRDFRAGPVVLVGAFNNNWTRHFSGDLRFSLGLDEYSRTLAVIDRDAPAQHNWQVRDTISVPKMTADYAIVARFRHPTAEQFIVIAAGLTRFGTMAAGEMLTNESYLAGLVNRAPADWENHNLEAVISTSVVNGESGPPQVVAVHSW